MNKLVARGRSNHKVVDEQVFDRQFDTKFKIIFLNWMIRMQSHKLTFYYEKQNNHL